MSSLLDNLINDFNNGGDEYEKTVGSVHNFLIFLNHKKRLDDINPFVIDDYRTREEVLKSYIKLGEWKKIKDKAINLLSDIEKRNKEYFLILTDREDISALFNDQNDGDTVKAILGDDSYEPYNDTVQDVYQDIISNLDKNALDEIKKYIIGLSLEVSPDTDLLVKIGEEQNNDDTVIIDASNIDRIINDSETMDFLLNNDLWELKRNLKNCADDAYNNVFISENYNTVMKELVNFFGSQGDFVTRKYNGKDRSMYEIDVSNCIDKILQSAINNDYDLEYYGSLMSLLSDSQEKIRIRFSDYADWHDTMKEINMNVSEYIHQ